MESLLKTVHDRIAAYQSGDPASVLASDAMTDAGRLWQEALAQSVNGRIPVEPVRALAILHWYRSAAQPHIADGSAEVAAGLFAMLAPTHPQLIPDQLRQIFTTRLAGYGTDLHALQAEAMLKLAQRIDDLRALDDAITLTRQAVAATCTDNPDQVAGLTNLGIGLYHRFGRTAQLADLDEALVIFRTALAATPTGHPHRLATLTNLGNALKTRFERIRDLSDLNERIETDRALIAATPTGHPSRASHLARLVKCLQLRCSHLGDLDDANEAIEVGRAALDSIPADHALRADILNLLNIGLQIRFRRLSDMADLHEAIAFGRAALAATPADHPDRGGRLDNLAGALRARFAETGDVRDGDEAIQATRVALDATAADAAPRAAMLANLASMLVTRFLLPEEPKDPRDLDEAIDLGRAAAAATPTDDPQRANRLLRLGAGLHARFERAGRRRDLEQAIDLWREAAGSTTAPASTRVRAAEAWAAAAASQDQWAAALHGYETAVGLLQLLVWRGIGRQSQELLLHEHAGLAANAAACAIIAGRPEQAIQLLEQGRNVLWSQLMQTRDDLTTLHEAAPALAAQIDAVRAQLDSPTDLAASGTAGDGPRGADSRRMLAAEWDMLLAQAREFPGFHQLLHPPEVASLRRAAAAGTVVVVNTSQWGGHALLITDSTTRVVPLPELSHDDAIRRANAHLGELEAFRHSRRDRLDQLLLEHAISNLLEWLWDTIAEPILDALGCHRTPAEGRPWPRLWWCPTGPLTVLPLHAAGYHTVDGESCRTVLDRVVSSYTPTLRALHRARTRPRSTAGPGRLLLVALPHTPQQPPLPAAVREHSVLTRLVPAEQRTVLVDAEATRAAILDALPQHDWAHASCHGAQILTDPAAGGLLPYDWSTAGPLTALDLTQRQSSGELIFLSACETALGGIVNLDEAINLTAALHYAGWRHVVGTLWSVQDDAAGAITEGFYQRLVKQDDVDAEHSAVSLHHTIREYRHRADHRRRPSRWAPFLHTGP